MTERSFSEPPNEPQASVPKRFLIDFEEATPKNRKSPYKHMKILRKLNKGKYQVYLIQCKNVPKNFALKLFKSKNRDISEKCFWNEVKFSSLCHPNINKILYYEQNREVRSPGKITMAPVIVKEYACHGDFFDFVNNYHQHFNDKMIRTYFRQLIEGLEYLQSVNVAHLDLRLENLLLDENFILKITDFDYSCYMGDRVNLPISSKVYGAPEMIFNKCSNIAALDIYSAGIILFVLKSGGKAPHTKDVLYKGIDLFKLLYFKNEEFWKKHCEIQNKTPSEFAEDFKELFHGMTRLIPEERFTIQEIKSSKWYNGPIYRNEDLPTLLKQIVR